MFIENFLNPISFYCLEPGMLIDCFSPMRADFLEKK